MIELSFYIYWKTCILKEFKAITLLQSCNFLFSNKFLPFWSFVKMFSTGYSMNTIQQALTFSYGVPWVYPVYNLSEQIYIYLHSIFCIGMTAAHFLFVLFLDSILIFVVE